MGPLAKFLLSLTNLVRSGAIKKIPDAIKFAKQEFGEVTPLLKKQIENVFSKIKKPEIGKPGKKEGTVLPFIKDKAPGEGKGLESLEEFRLSDDDPMGDLEQILNPRRPGGSLDQATGLTRTLARRILDRKGIEIGKKDPIDAFVDTFGEAIGDVKNLAEEMIEIDARGGGMKDMDQMLEIEGLFDIPVPKNPQKGLTDEEMSDIAKEIEREDILLKFDPEDREPNAMGGINRTNFRKGGIKLVGFLARKGKDLTEEIRKALNNFMQPSGDKKLDADVILDDMLEELGTDRDAIDQKDVIDVYGQIYDKLTANTATAEFLRPSKKIDLPDDVDPRDTILPTGDLVSKQLKVMRLAEEIQPGLFEKLNDTQLDIITKYGDMIDDNLLKQIVLDPDPNNQAAALATIEEAKIMLDKGMSVDEVLKAQGDALKRKTNAEGGLNYLMGF